VPDTLPLALWDHVDREGDALREDLRSGKLHDAEQRWHLAFEVTSATELVELGRHMDTWAGKAKTLLARIEPAKKQLVSADEDLKKAPESPGLYIEAWLALIQAQAMFEAQRAERLADLAKDYLTAEEDPTWTSAALRPATRALLRWFRELEGLPGVPVRDIDRNILEAFAALGSEAFPRKGVTITITESRPYTWRNIGGEQVTCTLTFRISGLRETPDSDLNVEAERGQAVSRSGWTPVAGREEIWETTVEFSLEADTWHGEPIDFKIVAVHEGKEVANKSITICSPYTIELPLGKGDIVADQWLFCQTTFHGSELDQRDHRHFKLTFNGDDFDDGEGDLRGGDTPSGRHKVPSDYADEPACIRLVVKSADGALLQKACFEGLARESPIIALYRDKRRHNFHRRLTALLLALLGGMAARRIFGLTFGSFEEYLGAFTWGVGAGAGIDPVAEGYKYLKEKVQELLGF
jgi:hypothetical protein